MNDVNIEDLIYRWLGDRRERKKSKHESFWAVESPRWGNLFRLATQAKVKLGKDMKILQP